MSEPLSHEAALDAICGCAATVTVLSYQEAIEAYLDLRGITEQTALAYGLLWRMQIDRRDPNLCLASDARKTLLLMLNTEQQAQGISNAHSR